MLSTAFSETHPNRLSAGLPPSVQQGMVSKMELVYLTKRQVLYEPGDPIMHVYFPCSAVVLLIMVMENGAGVEVATIGNDGFLGMPRYFGVESVFARGRAGLSRFRASLGACDPICSSVSLPVTKT